MDYEIPITKLSLPDWDEVGGDFKEIMTSGMITNNKFVKDFEQKLQVYLDVPNVVCCSSGSMGMIIALKCLKESGKMNGSEVIVPSFTFIASANAIKWAGFEPVFVDCERDTFNVDPQGIANAISSKTAAIMPVHTFGNPCDVKTIAELALDRDIKLVWDSCEAMGAKYHLRKIGSFGHVDVTAGSATKVFSISEGGMIGTEDGELAALMRKCRSATNFDDLKFPGLSSRMTEFQAVVGIHQLPKLDGYVADRNKVADLYKSELSGIPGISIQEREDRCLSNWFSMPMTINKEEFGMNRDELMEALKAKGIWARNIWFYLPCHRHPAYCNTSNTCNTNLTNTDYVSENIICLPMWSHMKEEEVLKVCGAVKEVGKK